MRIAHTRPRRLGRPLARRLRRRRPVRPRRGPDEFAVARNAPLVVPPDFALTPPRPGEADARARPIRAPRRSQALFGGPQPRSAVEQQPAAGRPCRARRARRPLGRRRSRDHGGRAAARSSRPCSSSPAGRRPGSLGQRSELTAPTGRHPGEGRDLVETAATCPEPGLGTPAFAGATNGVSPSLAPPPSLRAP